MSRQPELVGAMRSNTGKYFQKGKGPGLDTDKGSAQYVGGMQLQDGYSSVAHQDAPNPVAYTQSKTARKGGGFDLGKKEYIYEKIKAPEQVAAAPVPEPAPESEQPADPVTPSNTLQNAINTVNQTEADRLKSKESTFDPYELNKTRDQQRRDLTDSFSQKSYDPEAGIASEKAGNFLDDYKINLNDKISKMRSQYGNGNGGE